MFGTLHRGHATVSILLFLSLAARVEAATIKVGSDTVATQHSEQARLCVSLETRGNELVAGTENLLLWDGDCATMVEGSCKATSGHGKNLSGSLQKQRDFTYKALVLSFNDTNPIPAGELYCCEFLVHANPGDCCRVTVGSPGGSDPNGNSVSVGAGPPGQLCVAYDGQGSGGGRPVGNTFSGGGVSGGGVRPGGAAAPLGDSGVPSGGSAAPLGGGGAPASGFATSRDEAAPPDVGADRRVEPPPAPAADAAPAADPAPAAPRADPAPANPAAAAPPPAAPRAPGAAPDIAPATAGAATPAAAVPTPASPDAPLDPAPGGEDAEAGATGEEDAVVEEDASPAPKRADENQPKPSPRDVQRADRPRQFPLDDDGCHTTRTRGSAPVALALPFLALLLARRRRRI